MNKQPFMISLRKKNEVKPITLVLLIVFTFFVYKVYVGYSLVNPEKYGVDFNKKRNEFNIKQMPNTFILSKNPIDNFLDYFGATGIYSAEYTSQQPVKSGLVKIRIDVDENTIGIVREYQFFKRGNDTIIEINNYYIK